MLSLVQIKCKNAHDYGCSFYGPFYELESHHEWCDKVFCSYCDEQLTHQTLRQHRCMQMIQHRLGGSRENYYIKKSMVPKGSLVSALKCAECCNILRDPIKCKHCETLYCQLCLKESSYYARGTCPNKKCLKPFESSPINR